MKYINKDEDGNIVSIFDRKQKHHTEADQISEDDLRTQLQAQELQWDHGYND